MIERFVQYLASHQDQILANLGSAFLLVTLIGGLIWLLYFLDRQDDREFKIVDCFKGPGDRASFWRIGNAFGLFTSTWLVITMELAGHTSEVVVGSYLLYCVGGYASQALLKDKPKPEDKPGGDAP